MPTAAEVYSEDAATVSAIEFPEGCAPEPSAREPAGTTIQWTASAPDEDRRVVVADSTVDRRRQPIRWGCGSLVHQETSIRREAELFHRVMPAGINHDEMEQVFYPRVAAPV